MRILFVHQNFPAQYRHLASAVVGKVGWEVVALAMRTNQSIDGIRVVLHSPDRNSTPNVDPLASEFERKVIRGRSAARAALEIKASGFSPDVICGHPGWGETLFLKDVWPNAKMISFFEFYYHTFGSDFNFDPEFLQPDFEATLKLRVKNATTLLSLSAADRVVTPTKWQASQLPREYNEKLSIIHDGIDTRILRPAGNSYLELKRDGIRIQAGDEILTFVNRNLEPYRGFHSFMRALPSILHDRRDARVIIVGGRGVSYGRPSETGESYRDIFLNEVKDHLDMSRVHFVGNLTYSNYVKLLQISACHVYLTYPFVLSWSMLEALSIGCIVVASDTGPVTEFITNRYNGILVNFFNPDQISSSVIEILRHPQDFQKIRDNARESAATFDLTRVCLPAQLGLIENC